MRVSENKYWFLSEKGGGSQGRGSWGKSGSAKLLLLRTGGRLHLFRPVFCYSRSHTRNRAVRGGGTCTGTKGGMSALPEVGERRLPPTLFILG